MKKVFLLLFAIGFIATMTTTHSFAQEKQTGTKNTVLVNVKYKKCIAESKACIASCKKVIAMCDKEAKTNMAECNRLCKDCITGCKQAINLSSV